jgi:DNA processing protein
MDDKCFVLGITKVKGIGPIKYQKLIARFGNPRQAWDAKPKQWMQVLGDNAVSYEDFANLKVSFDPKKFHEKLIDKNIKYLTIMDSDYPALLKEIYAPPPLLFYKGELKKSKLNIAIVGSRKCSHYGKEVTNYLSGQLAKLDINVVSGMARGIDSLAHKGALAKGGYTTAVLGSGVDVIYPPENKALYQQIVKQGVVFSEFHPKTTPEAYNFPARNRLISGISHGVIIVEAAEKSGSLITANFALEQNREVFAVPGNINSKSSKGTNNLIRQGAKIVTGINAILEEFNLFYEEVKKQSQPQLTDNEIIVLKHLGETPIGFDDLNMLVKMQPQILNSTLTMLEIKGLISLIPGKRIVKDENIG